VDLVIDKVKELKAAAPGKYWEVGQFVNTDNIEAHYRTTGPEIWEQTEGKIGALVLSQGTGGTVTGAGKYLKEQNPNIKIFAVEPAECDILSGGSWGPHKIEGIGDGFIPEVLHVQYLDGVVTTTSDESIEMARRMSREEGIFCGISSGCPRWGSSFFWASSGQPLAQHSRGRHWRRTRRPAQSRSCLRLLSRPARPLPSCSPCTRSSPGPVPRPSPSTWR